MTRILVSTGISAAESLVLLTIRDTEQGPEHSYAGTMAAFDDQFLVISTFHSGARDERLPRTVCGVRIATVKDGFAVYLDTGVSYDRQEQGLLFPVSNPHIMDRCTLGRLLGRHALGGRKADRGRSGHRLGGCSAPTVARHARCTL